MPRLMLEQEWTREVGPSTDSYNEEGGSVSPPSLGRKHLLLPTFPPCVLPPPALQTPLVLPIKIRFSVTRIETLGADGSGILNVLQAESSGSFHFIFGVNTFDTVTVVRTELACTKDLAALLTPGGVSLMMDMQRRFPASRSKLHDTKNPVEERCLPSHEEDSLPFGQAGLQALRKETCCWIPDSAGRTRTRVCRLLAPGFDLFGKSMVMRSLVVSGKS